MGGFWILAENVHPHEAVKLLKKTEVLQHVSYVYVY